MRAARYMPGPVTDMSYWIKIGARPTVFKVPSPTRAYTEVRRTLTLRKVPILMTVIEQAGSLIMPDWSDGKALGKVKRENK